MKILILSDCHANVDALNAVWEKESDCDVILFAGDMVDFGLNPKETVHWFMERADRLFAVRGNHDEYILAHRYDPKPAGEPRDFQQLTFSQLGEEEYDFLASLPHERIFTIDDTDFYMCHTPDELSDEVAFSEEQLERLQIRTFLKERFDTMFPHGIASRKIVVYGHSHMQWAASAGERDMVLNPGSLSYRFGSLEEIRCADYTVLEGDGVFMRHVNFDTDRLYERANQFADSEAARLGRAFYRKRGDKLW